VKTICTIIVTLAALGFVRPGQAAAQSVLEQKLDKIITVLEKGQQANEARFRRIEALLPSIEARLAQVEQRSSSAQPPAPASYSGYAPARPQSSYAPGYAPPPGVTPCYTYATAPASFAPLADSPLSPAEQLTLIEYLDRVTNRGGDSRMSPAEQQVMAKVVQLMGK
jgi:hypothetical protein